MTASNLGPSNNQTEIKVIDLGLSAYEEVLEFQRRYLKDLIVGNQPEALIVCEHHAIITHGRAANLNNILSSRAELLAQNINILEVERGGDVTWHGPGQLVAYPLLDLRQRKPDVGWYLRSLEQVIINFLEEYQIVAQRICNKTGVWVQDQKIASIGVKLSRWCTMHGLSINYLNCQNGFSAIRACGLPEVKLTSIIEQQPNLSSRSLGYTEVSTVFIRHFLTQFNLDGHEEKK